MCGEASSTTIHNMFGRTSSARAMVTSAKKVAVRIVFIEIISFSLRNSEPCGL
jgi:hypothetical protein